MPLVNPPLEIAARGKQRRRSLGLTTDDLARRLSCSRGRVHNLECYGATTITLIAEWACALEMDPRDLAFGPLTND
jgi:transcriptional regulator with XRE-family HTH domain